MDSQQFDDLVKRFAEPASRRSSLRSMGAAAVGGVFAFAGLADAAVGKKKKKKKKKKKGERCGARTCAKSQFCCDDTSQLCCTKGGECCNPGSGTGSCCDAPNRCGLPFGNDSAPRECCPPERQWFTSVGLVRCCPPGERAIKGITSDDGACCPEAKFCGDTCCADGLVCSDPDTGRCCAEGTACGLICCNQNQVCTQPCGATKAACCPRTNPNCCPPCPPEGCGG